MVHNTWYYSSYKHRSKQQETWWCGEELSSVEQYRVPEIFHLQKSCCDELFVLNWHAKHAITDYFGLGLPNRYSKFRHVFEIWVYKYMHTLIYVYSICCWPHKDLRYWNYRSAGLRPYYWITTLYHPLGSIRNKYYIWWVLSGCQQHNVYWRGSQPEKSSSYQNPTIQWGL